MDWIVGTLAGAILGLAIGYALWAVALTRTRQDHARALEQHTQASVALATREAELAAERARADSLAPVRDERDRIAGELAALTAGSAAREAALGAREADLRQQFDSLAQAALQGAQARFEALSASALAQHRAAADTGLKELLTPVADTLKRYEEGLKGIETARTEGYGKLTGLLDELARGQQATVTATARLETALRSSGKAAGYWGEGQCRNVLEMAGLVEGIDFTAQTSVMGEDGRQQPDFLITLPGGRALVIDVKCSLANFVSATEKEGEDQLAALKAHAKAVRAHAVGLASKSYEKAVPGAVDFVMLFVPGESLLAAALEHDRALMNDFFNKRVLLAGPINLIAVARTVAAMRDQARLQKEAAEIAKLGRELYESLRIMGSNLVGVQKAIDGTVTSWNRFTAQLDSRVIVRARKFEALGPTTGLDPIADVAAVETVPLLPNAADFSPKLLAAE